LSSSSTEARTVVITGGNTGVGYACATALAESPDGPWHLVLACRDAGRAQQAVDKLARQAAPGTQVEAMSLDLASMASVRAFAAELTHRIRSGRIPALQALVCNAGVQAGLTVQKTADGFESTFGTNHLGHFLLVNELAAVLQAPARVVVVASDTHDPALKMPVPAPAWNDVPALARGELGPAAAADKPFTSGQRRYTTSKLANVYFAYALSRRLPAGASANAYNPGMVPGTGLQRDAAAPVRIASKYVMPYLRPLLRLLVTPNVRTAKESGSALAWLATSPDTAGITGQYFDGRQAVRSSSESYDEARAENLWTESLVLTDPSTSVA
jgi:NAD(P)-dependent dehydrogenase (short-subunit alcohol dehydrogenase family)